MGTMRERSRTVTVKGRLPGPPRLSAREEFEHVYRRNIGVLTRYFARRCQDPQTVADLTSETVVRAVSGFAGYDPRKGAERAWLLGIASRVFARHCEQSASGRDAVVRLEGRRVLDEDDMEELAERIDAEREGAALLVRCAQLPAHEREAIELIDLEGLTPKEAAQALGISHVAVRKRLSRARARLKKQSPGDE